ncbi:hypothetical protein THAOC_01416 [Thalassiosira oceanica]|uniref:Uncharacterized protein n=1 Tax=Thalassiosira oceanica TaxID=159749 RepID=K0TQX4_THAOC|nr:hypothetical protein THAOC_01416 [Thalassiosira oceanica]|eukprot:EJK76802.1 hypothetical protein THAOC_01416 [Thalassiosira oceanica]
MLAALVKYHNKTACSRGAMGRVPSDFRGSKPPHGKASEAGGAERNSNLMTTVLLRHRLDIGSRYFKETSTTTLSIDQQTGVAVCSD